MTQRILAIDDDPATTGALRKLLEKKGFEVREENDSTRALAAAREFQPHVVILDYLMPRVHGGDVAWQLASDATLRDVRVIICSGVADWDLATKLPPARIPILAKPINADALLALLADG
jgi:DNA-binding NtrC family response regulator